MRILTLVAISLSATARQTTSDVPRASFDDTLARHVAAIQSRDYGEIEATITRGNEIVLIFPDGTRYTTREQFLAFHREWFADKNWVMTLEPVRRWHGSDYGYGLYRTSFDPDGAGPAAARAAWLSLGFRLEEGDWRLVHDQNTRITEDAGS
ncbi:MAG: DUF4440 domain-containing protein [Erythrobacter sp.]